MQATASPRPVPGLRKLVALLFLPLLAGLVALPDGGQAHAVVPNTATRQATANIAFSLGPARARADIHNMSTRADVIGWQEIANGYQATAIEALPRFDTWWPGGRTRAGRILMNPRNSNPISYRSDIWQRVDQGTRLTMRALVGVCRDRWVSWVVLKHRRTGRLIARWNVHFVPGAWSSRPYSRQSHRQALWLQQSRIVTGLHNALVARRLPVFGGGDINRRNYPFAGPSVVYDTLSSGRIDNLAHGRTRRVAATGRPLWIGLHSDHDGLVVPYVVGTDVAPPPPPPPPPTDPKDEEPDKPDDDDGPGNGNGHGHGKDKNRG